MRYLIAAAVLALLTACSSGNDAAASQPKSPESSPTEAASQGVAETCDALAAALPDGPDGTYDDQQMRTFLDSLTALNNQGDAAVRLMLRPMATPVAQLASGAGADVHREFLEALDDIAADCEAAGSTALQ